MADKSKSIIEYLQTCPYLQDTKLFFNFAEATDDIKQLVTVATSSDTNRKYIDGSQDKTYSITLIDYRSVAYQALVNASPQNTSDIDDYPNENVEEFVDVQAVMEWIDTQNDAENFPDFGDNCVVEEIKTTTDIPNLNGVDSSIQPTLAKYSITIQVKYLDKTKTLWR